MGRMGEMGISWKHTLRLIEKINHPNFRLIFDTGNPVFNYSWIGNPPYPLQSSWEFYRNVREFISYVHIKDGTAMPTDSCRVRPPCLLPPRLPTHRHIRTH